MAPKNSKSSNTSKSAGAQNSRKGTTRERSVHRASEEPKPETPLEAEPRPATPQSAHTSGNVPLVCVARVGMLLLLILLLCGASAYSKESAPVALLPGFTRSAVKGPHSRLVARYCAFGKGFKPLRFASESHSANLAAAKTIQLGMPSATFTELSEGSVTKAQLSRLLRETEGCGIVFAPLRRRGEGDDAMLHLVKGLRDEPEVQCKLLVISTQHTQEQLEAQRYGGASVTVAKDKLGGMGAAERIYHSIPTYILANRPAEEGEA